MSAPKKSTPKKGTAQRKQSKLTLAGDEASRLARRTLLVTTLGTCGWNLARAASALDLASGADVIRALKELAPEEYEAARADGRIAPGRRSDA